MFLGAAARGAHRKEGHLSLSDGRKNKETACVWAVFCDLRGQSNSTLRSTSMIIHVNCQGRPSLRQFPEIQGLQMNYSKFFDRLSSIEHQVRQNPRCHMDECADFSEIPSSHRGFLDLVYWSSREYRTIEDIHDGFRSDRLMFYSLYERPHRFEYIASSSPRYYAICEFALWRHSHAIREVPQVFMTEALVRRLTLCACAGVVQSWNEWL